ncbi:MULTISPECIES: YciI family protein [Arthrobacter]|uniref:YciI family protein n=1 Tax=Arthrobacter caoxuetaonis TaxID=2886935 RepID=A0A9X1MDP3_9MICC|nr:MULTISPECIES: YciI family protein [Arthrobacter]MCC3283924.1 YciI family protein [Arthrobacter caoxuetaonis]MCC3297082.1 YciI family protein [Arthrobacter caoxuetaonis]MCC9193969.1 YciI family protein [Arthrobacter sp. zg-Y916]USQ58353.1 YciI family protein [Arthrobacter caoxuetaonis]
MSIFAVEYVYDAESAELRAQHRPAHREWLAALVEEGRVLASGPFADGAGALLIFTAESEEDLNNLLKQDPLAAGGGISGLKTTEWQPVTGAFSHLAS